MAVLEGELVETLTSANNTLENRSVITPKKQEKILELLKEVNPEEGKLFTLTSLARKARIPHKAFIAQLHHALENPRHKLHVFALDIMEQFAIQQDYLMQQSFLAAKDKGRWEGPFTFLERLYSDEFRKPSQASAPNVTQNIGVVEKLALIAGGNKELTTGD